MVEVIDQAPVLPCSAARHRLQTLLRKAHTSIGMAAQHRCLQEDPELHHWNGTPYQPSAGSFPSTFGASFAVNVFMVSIDFATRDRPVRYQWWARARTLRRQPTARMLTRKLFRVSGAPAPMENFANVSVLQKMWVRSQTSAHAPSELRSSLICRMAGFDTAQCEVGHILRKIWERRVQYRLDI